MHLLILTARLPYPNGGANTRNYHLLKALASKHRVTLLAYAGSTDPDYEVAVEHLKTLTDKLEVVPYIAKATRTKRLLQLFNTFRGKSYILGAYFSPGVQQALDTFTQQNDIDAVYFESALMAGYQLPASIQVVIDQHNIEYEILERTRQSEKGFLRRWYNGRESQLLKPVELERCRRANAVIMTSEREQQILQDLLPEQNIVTVPNGVDIDFFARTAIEPVQEIPGRIIFTGTMNYYPNTNAALKFARECWPRIREQVPDATWQIVGREPPAEVRELAELPGVEVTGSVADTRPYLAQAEVALAPLHIGSGTRLKILEALSMEKALVTTSIGCEGIDAVAGEHVLIEDDPEAFARAVIMLLKDQQRRKQLGTTGRHLVEQRYSWQQCGERLLHTVEHLKEKERVC